MNDLLCCKSNIKGTNYVNLRQDNMRDLEMGDVRDASEDSNLKAFFGDVYIIQSDMEKAKQLLSSIQSANEEGKTIHKAQVMKTLRERMEEDMLEIMKRAKSIKANLEDLDKANVVNRSCHGYETGSPVDRTRMSSTNALRKRLKDLMEEFQLLRHRIMTEYKETVGRRVYTVTGQRLDEDTVEQIIKTGESEKFLQTAIHEQGKGQMMEIIRELRERHDAAKEIEQNLLDLHQIFLDMSVMVEGQGEKLNNMQHNVNEADTHIDHGTQHLKDAKYYQRNSFKYASLAIMILLMLIIFLVIPLVIGVRK